MGNFLFRSQGAKTETTKTESTATTTTKAAPAAVVKPTTEAKPSAAKKRPGGIIGGPWTGDEGKKKALELKAKTSGAIVSEKKRPKKKNGVASTTEFITTYTVLVKE